MSRVMFFYSGGKYHCQMGRRELMRGTDGVESRGLSNGSAVRDEGLDASLICR